MGVASLLPSAEVGSGGHHRQAQHCPHPHRRPRSQFSGSYAAGEEETDQSGYDLNGFVTDPLCCPSRASILRGQLVHSHGVKTNFKPSAHDAFHDLGQGNSTVATWLHDGDYRTALIGKYMNAYDQFCVLQSETIGSPPTGLPSTVTSTTTARWRPIPITPPTPTYSLKSSTPT